jgi:hypothetical protein
MSAAGSKPKMTKTDHRRCGAFHASKGVCWTSGRAWALGVKGSPDDPGFSQPRPELVRSIEQPLGHGIYGGAGC